MRHRHSDAPSSGRGAALAISLIVLTALSVLGIAGMSAVTTEIIMAQNLVFQQAADAAASSGIELALAAGPFPIDRPKTVTHEFGHGVTVSATVEYRTTTQAASPGFSSGLRSSGIRAYHYEIESTGRAPRGAVARQRQGFFVLGPEP